MLEIQSALRKCSCNCNGSSSDPAAATAASLCQLEEVLRLPGPSKSVDKLPKSRRTQSVIHHLGQWPTASSWPASLHQPLAACRDCRSAKWLASSSQVARPHWPKIKLICSGKNIIYLFQGLKNFIIIRRIKIPYFCWVFPLIKINFQCSCDRWLVINRFGQRLTIITATGSVCSSAYILGGEISPNSG